MNEPARIQEILDSGTKDDKISIIESLSQSSDQEVINKIITKLDDSEIEIRGEAFSSLFLNKNDISKFLIDALSSENKNIKAFSALVLANRGDVNAMPALELLVDEIFLSGTAERAKQQVVESCALGALQYLRAYCLRKGYGGPEGI